MDVHTRPDPARAALVTVDMQNDFTIAGAPAEIPGTREIVPALLRAVQAFRAARRPIVHVIRLYAADGSDAERVRRAALEGGKRMLRAGTEGAGIVEELLPADAPALDAECLRAGRPQELGPREWAIYKPRWNSFFRTPLAGHLQAEGVDSVVVAGCNFPNCTRATTVGATEYDFRTAILRDAVSGLDDRGAHEMDGIGVEVMSADACCAWIGSGGPARAQTG